MVSSLMIIFGGFLLYSLIHVGSSIKCYECQQPKGQKCTDKRGVELPKVECSAGHVCVRHWIPGFRGDSDPRNAEMIKRACVDADYCERNLTYAEEYADLTIATRICSVCNTDFCNSATSLVIPTFIIVIMFFATLVQIRSE